MILTQTGAMFRDAFRELHARKLFWITMILSALVIFALAPFGSQPGVGITYAVWTIPGTDEIAVDNSLFLRSVIISVGISLWLTWVATIIAIISTAGIVPALVTDGAIDTMLSKPIGRVRLFLTKYCTGLLFVAMQVTVFSIGAILMLGLRAGDWEFGFFLAIPIVVLFFSYLYAVSALVGFLSKSGLTALLITGLFWGGLIGLNRTEEFLMSFKHGAAYERDRAASQIEYQQSRIERIQGDIDAAVAAGEEPFRSDLNNINTARENLAEYTQRLPDATANVESLEKWQGRIQMVKAILPKTAETVRLLERYVISEEEAQAAAEQQASAQSSDRVTTDANGDVIEVARDPSNVQSMQTRLDEELRSSSLWWVLGTSLGFEAVLLIFTCFLFSRRDF